MRGVCNSVYLLLSQKVQRMKCVTVLFKCQYLFQYVEHNLNHFA